MNSKKLKVVVLTHGGANRLLEVLSAIETVEIAGVFIETATKPNRSLKEKLKRSVRYDGYWTTAKKFSAILFGGETAMDLLKKTNADLGILYGTNIIKESVFSIPRLGSINLHQGLAPIYRGGPTVFWELFNGEKEIGITIHFVASKVDTGDIILQKTLPLEYDFSRYELDYENFLRDFRASLKEPSVQLIAEAVSLIADGREQRIKQDTTIGKRYRLPTKTEKDALLRVLKERRHLDGIPLN